MKIILSRKGSDSASGGIPSPIFPNGKMISIPIPDDYSSIHYSDISTDQFVLGDIAQKLSKGLILPFDRAHLDPDLNQMSINRMSGWKSIFGQCGAAQGHLSNNEEKGTEPFIKPLLIRLYEACLALSR